VLRDTGKTRECSRSPIASWSGKEAGLEELRASATFGWDGCVVSLRNRSSGGHPRERRTRGR
jgi:hypothetical protein